MQGPTLNALRAFEAAARHQSFARAAKELHVTPAAVSQQMRALEVDVGVPLFVRGARSLSLTPEGREYALAVRRSLTELGAATKALGRADRQGRLTITTFQSFATLWLLPRLADFRQRFPEIDVRLLVDAALRDPATGEVDVAIRFGAGDYPGCDVELLLHDAVVPVCSPALLAGRPLPRRPADLTAFPLVHHDGLVKGERRLRWQDWIGEAAAGRPAVHMPDGFLVVHAALLGQGVALARRSLVMDHLRDGRLVQLLDEERPMDYRYWLVTGAGDERPRVQAFKRWLIDAAAAPALPARANRDILPVL
jgi:LysR family glycine cleavage system transcriptional activator